MSGNTLPIWHDSGPGASEARILRSREKGLSLTRANVTQAAAFLAIKESVHERVRTDKEEQSRRTKEEAARRNDQYEDWSPMIDILLDSLPII